MYDLQPPFVGPRRAHRASLKPEDAAAMMVQRRNSQRLSIIHNFYPPVVDTPAMAKWRSPDVLDSFARRRSASPTRNSEYIQSSLPEVSIPRPQSIRRKPIKRPAIDFRSLPDGVVDCVLEELRYLHNGRSSSSCTTCYMRDLVAVQLSCKKWSGRAKNKLYTAIDIIGEDSVAQLKKYKMQRGSGRLRLLRRTLRNQPEIASLVRDLNVPDPDIPLFLPNGKPNPAFDEYRNLVASVVMTVPNLERLTGFYSWYNHEFDRLTHALSTRRNLREHSWIVTENDELTARSRVQLPPLMDSKQVQVFLEYHSCWPKLETLMVCAPGGTGLIDHDVFVQALQSLPSLKSLSIGGFDADDFSDNTLLALPKITSLRLEECAGISDNGLARWAARPGAAEIERLALIHISIHSLLTVSKLLACLHKLTKFTVISDITPSLPVREMVIQPVLASSSLKRLHWDVLPDDRFSEDSQESPNSHLAMSILHSGFPKLHSLRAPRDLSPPGALQAVCRPATSASVLLPSDRFSLNATSDLVRSASIPTLSRGNSLRTARIRAQGYIDANNKSPKEFMRVLITDHSREDAYDDEHDSSSSSGSSFASTEGTDPIDLFSPTDAKLAELDVDQTDLTGPRVDIDAAHRPFFSDWPSSMDGTPRGQAKPSRTIPVPPRSPLRPRPIEPLRVSEFSVPSFIGRVSSSAQLDTARPPKFDLKPDVEGYNSNGGVIGWGDLLRMSEKARPDTEDGKPWIRNGCTGTWNKGQGKPLDFCRHTERPRRRIGSVIEADCFF